MRIRRPDPAAGATDVLATAALTGNLTEVEAILAAPADQPITADLPM